VATDVFFCVQTSVINLSLNEIVLESSFGSLVFGLWLNTLYYKCNKLVVSIIYVI